jgi:dienelactone hydrolase
MITCFPSHPSLRACAGRESSSPRNRAAASALLSALLAIALSAGIAPATGLAASESGPWDVPALERTPAATWGAVSGLVQEVTYAGEPLRGKPTQVFAYYAKPAGAGPFPGVVLVHGGGGKAFREWTEHWAQRGYAALAMDTAGNGPAGRLPDGGPDQNDEEKFREFSADGVRDMWTYHAVAAVLRAHSLLLARPEVDPQRTALTGISWGGYLTCIVAGLDHRFKAAVPVYGCGFLAEDSYWVGPQFAKMDEARRARWVQAFDPSRYLGGATCPMLFVNGTNDFAYPLDSHRKSFALVQAPKTLSLKINLPHGHIWTMLEVDTFIDGVLTGGLPLATFTEPQVAAGRLTASLAGKVDIAKVELCYTTDTGKWQQRAWRTMPAEDHAGAVSVALPATRPLTCFLLATDVRGLCVSTTHVEIAP